MSYKFDKHLKSKIFFFFVPASTLNHRDSTVHDLYIGRAGVRLQYTLHAVRHAPDLCAY